MELSKTIQNKLAEKGVSYRTLETFPLRDVVHRETKGNEQKDLLLKCANLEMFDRVIALDCRYCDEASQIVALTKKSCQVVLSDLIRQNLVGYYFLNTVDVYSSRPEGHVVLLRRMQAMDSAFATNIATGIEKGSPLEKEGTGQGLTFEHDPLCLITGVLRSPDIEHLMQQFSNLFTRIGLEDQVEETLQFHLSLLNS